MSRVGKLPIAVPQGVNVNLTENEITVKGPKGELKTAFTGDVKVEFTDGKILVNPANDGGRARTMWGTVRSNIKNLVEGVSTGFTKVLDIQGVGYRAAVAGDEITLSLGFSHDIKYVVPQGISVQCEKQTRLIISGANKQVVGQVAAEIRSLRKPEPYKGKGVRYEDERVRMKEGKKK